MQAVFGLAALAVLVALAVGMVAPAKVLPAAMRPSRIKVLAVYVVALFALGGIGMALEPAEQKAEREAAIRQEAERRASPEFQQQAALAAIKDADRAIKGVEVVGEVLHVTIDPGTTWSKATYIRDIASPMVKALEVAKDQPGIANFIRFNGNTDLAGPGDKTTNETVIRLQVAMADARKIAYGSVDKREVLNFAKVVSEQRQIGLSREYCGENANASAAFCAQALSR